MESKSKRKGAKSPVVAKVSKKSHGVQVRDETKSNSSENEANKTVGAKKSVPVQEHLCFKNPKYRESGFVTKTKVWKNLKQIMQLQKSQATSEIHYASIDAPPSTKPVKKYSDLSGLQALYTDPQTKLRYSNSDEYRMIETLSSDTVMGLLALRRATY